MNTGNKPFVVIADKDYLPLLLLHKNRHPELVMDLISPEETLDLLGYSYTGDDPIPALLQKGIDYSSAKKFLSLLRYGGEENNPKLKEVNSAVKDYLKKDAYGKRFFEGKDIYLFELQEHVALKSLLSRNELAFAEISIDKLDIEKRLEVENPPVFHLFEDKFHQYMQLFALIRERLLKDSKEQGHIRILASAQDDHLFLRLMSSIFDIPVRFAYATPLLEEKEVKDKLHAIYETHDFSFSAEELGSPLLKTLKAQIEHFGLANLPFEFAYANLLEIIRSQNLVEAIGDKGILVTDSFRFEPDAIYYCANFEYGVFHEVIEDKSVLSDEEILTCYGLPSYRRTMLDKRKKKNFLFYQNIAYFSRVKTHLSDALFPSQFIQDYSRYGWKETLTDVTEGSFTSKSKRLLEADRLDQAFLYDNDGVYRSYDPSFDGEDIVLPKKRENYSVTNLERYISCPYRYYLDEMLPNKDYGDPFPAIRGIFIHRVLERIHQDDYDFEREFALARADFPKACEKMGIVVTKREEAMIEILYGWLKRGVAQLRLWNDNMSLISHSDDFEREIRFTLQDERGSYPFKGYIDKILWTESEGQRYYAILDYKTGAEEFNPLVVFLGQSTQLPLYWYAIENSVDKESYTGGGEFIGFGMQHPFAKTLSGMYGADGVFSSDNYQKKARFSGMFDKNEEPFLSLDATSKAKKGIKKNGGDYVQSKFNFFDLMESSILKESLASYSPMQLQKDAITATLMTIHKIEDGLFPIAPTTYDLTKFNPNQLVCNNCPYKDICYRNPNTCACSYETVIAERFQSNKEDE